MFNFSSKTYVNKEYKVSDFLKQIKASKEIKEDSKIITNIYFRNVINSQTLNCEENDKYKNIYVIEIDVDDFKVPMLFIEAIDKNIAFHTYFIVKYGDSICSIISYKNITKNISIDKYYSHSFHKIRMINIPILSNVANFYKFLLSYEIGISYFDTETPEDYISRVKHINKLKFQISKTEKAIVFESQPKKKFEYNNRLKEYKKEYDLLLNKGEIK